jgi:hypothetical protein
VTSDQLSCRIVREVTLIGLASACCLTRNDSGHSSMIKDQVVAQGAMARKPRDNLVY